MPRAAKFRGWLIALPSSRNSYSAEQSSAVALLHRSIKRIFVRSRRLTVGVNDPLRWIAINLLQNCHVDPQKLQIAVLSSRLAHGSADSCLLHMISGDGYPENRTEELLRL
jgi:hypothetical protein